MVRKSIGQNSSTFAAVSLFISKHVQVVERHRHDVQNVFLCLELTGNARNERNHARVEIARINEATATVCHFHRYTVIYLIFLAAFLFYIDVCVHCVCACLCAEVVYAAESYKKIIPLTLEPRYNPHGWLRFHTSDGLRYDFSSNESFEDSFKKLVRALKKCYSSSGTDQYETS